MIVSSPDVNKGMAAACCPEDTVASMDGFEYRQVEDWLRRAPASPSYYEILGVHIDAGTDVIHTAWKLAARKHHPDRHIHLGPESELAAREKMVALNEAWAVLRDPTTRRRYDLLIGIRLAPCSRCGTQGRLRLAAGGTAVGLCDLCYSRH